MHIYIYIYILVCYIHICIAFVASKIPVISYVFLMTSPTTQDVLPVKLPIIFLRIFGHELVCNCVGFDLVSKDFRIDVQQLGSAHRPSRDRPKKEEGTRGG